MKQTNQNNLLESEELYLSNRPRNSGNDSGGNDPHVSEEEKTEEQNPRPLPDIPRGGTTSGSNGQVEDEKKAEGTNPKPLN